MMNRAASNVYEPNCDVSAATATNHIKPMLDLDQMGEKKRERENSMRIILINLLMKALIDLMPWVKDLSVGYCLISLL